MGRENPGSQAEIIESPESISVREAARQLGQRGGRSTLERRGTEFFREIGAKGGKRQKELYRELLSEFGKRGGRPKRQNLEDSLRGESPEKKEADAVGPGDSPPA